MVTLSHIELGWMIQALERNAAQLREYMAEDGRADYEVYLAQLSMKNLNSVSVKLQQVIANKDKRISVNAPK